MSTLSSAVHPVYAVVTAERMLRATALDGILSALGDHMDTLGPTRVDGARAELSEVLDELRTMSLLGGRRIVVVDDADPFITANRQSLEKYCSSPADSGSLVLLCNAMPANTKLYKIITKMGNASRLEAPKGRRVLSWLQDRAQSEYGKRIGGSASQMLLDYVGGALGILDAELSKLVTYIGDRDEIGPSDVAALTGRHREEKIFAVTDAMDVGDVAGAMSHWHQVLATDRAAPARALAGLAWSVRRLLDVCRQWAGGANIQVLARTMYTDPQVLRERLQRSGPEQLELRQKDLLTAEIEVKTGLTTVESAIEKFIVKHTVVLKASA